MVDTCRPPDTHLGSGGASRFELVVLLVVIAEPFGDMTVGGCTEETRGETAPTPSAHTTPPSTGCDGIVTDHRGGVPVLRGWEEADSVPSL